MMFELLFTERASRQYEDLEKRGDKEAALKAVRKALGLMEKNLKHPSLNTHEYSGLGDFFGKVFESYAQNHTPGAYRIFWHYGPKKRQITVIAIIPHP